MATGTKTETQKLNDTLTRLKKTEEELEAMAGKFQKEAKKNDLMGRILVNELDVPVQKVTEARNRAKERLDSSDGTG